MRTAPLLRLLAFFSLPFIMAFAGGISMADNDVNALAESLRALDAAVLSPDERARAATMLGDDCRARLREASRRDSAEWAKVSSRADWERFRDARIQALRASLGTFPAAPQPLRVETTGTLDGQGFRIEKLVFESRPHLLVTANLYVPDPPREKMPGFLVVHSHHNPKTQDELQDMGVNWARVGSMVLIMDQIGHGERRQQPFAGREEYRSRYFTGMQLHLIGESLCGWMAYDLMRGVDLLLARPGIDREKIILIGSVAGGGDPAAVTAALDPRITCSVPFNFGGPQPETTYPLPPDADAAFNYAGSGSFESTRNLRLSARDGFLPYAIVAAAAPRPLIYGHEFAWDQERDPVWKRFQRIYGFYGAPDRLAAMHGWGKVTLRPPEASHCNNVGPAHRKEIYPYLQRWFSIPPAEEVRERRKADELRCLTDAVAARLQPKLVHELAAAIAAERGAAVRADLAKLDPPERIRKLRQDWARLLGDVEPRPPLKTEARGAKQLAGASVESILLQAEERVAIPMLLLAPAKRDARAPVVVLVSAHGKQRVLEARSREVAALLQAGVAVCLPDVRGTGETDPGDGPGRHNKLVDTSSTEQMLGQTLLGLRLRDLRAVVRCLATRPDLDAARLALWGESLAEANPEPFEDPPQDGPHEVKEARPLGGLLALFGALFEDSVRAVVVRRGLVGYASMLSSHFSYLPHADVVPGALTAGDLCDVAAALAPRPLRLEGLVSARNIPVPEAELRRCLEPAVAAYAGHAGRLALSPGPLASSRYPTDDVAAWLAAALK